MCFAPQRRVFFRHFFDIWTSKSGPSMVCFVYFDFKMYFAPQRRALFRHRNFPKMVRSWCVLNILTWKCVSMCFAPQRRAFFRHRNFQKWSGPEGFYILTWKWPARHFSEPTFRPSGATNHWKNTMNRDFPVFSRIYLFFLLILSFLTLLTSAFQLPILSEISLLNFLRLYIYIL